MPQRYCHNARPPPWLLPEDTYNARLNRIWLSLITMRYLVVYGQRTTSIRACEPTTIEGFQALLNSRFSFGDDRGVGYFENIPGEAFRQYLADFAAKFGLLQRTRYETTVLSKPRSWMTSQTVAGSWCLEPPEGHKLIIGTGLHNKPLPVNIKGQGSFDAHLLHAGQFETEAPEVIAHSGVEQVTV